MAKRHRACAGKQRHATRDAAEAQRQSLKRNRFAPLDLMAVCKCSHCGFFHVGHKPGSRTRR